MDSTSGLEYWLPFGIQGPRLPIYIYLHVMKFD